MYKVLYTEEAIKNLKKLDKYTKQILFSWIEKKLSGCENPRAFGKPLTANHKGKWRYRVGDYRILCEINDAEITILIVTIGHRRDVYEK